MGGSFLAYGSNVPPPGLGGKGFFGATPARAAVAGWTTLVTGFEASPNHYLAIDFINNTFVISANDGSQTVHTVITSTDGSTWTQNNVAATGIGLRMEGCGFGNGVYALSMDSAGPASRVYTSPDLVSWTQRNPGFAAGQLVSRPVFGNGVFLMTAVGAADYATSTNGITWTHHNAYVPVGWGTRPIFDGSRFVSAVLGTIGTPKLAVSTDGINWTESTITLAGPTSSPGPVAWNGSLYVVGNGIDDTGDAVNSILTAQTPFSFNDAGNPTEAMSWGTSTFERCNVNTATVQSSPDGVNWTQDTVPAAANDFQDIAHGLGKFIAVGIDNSGNNYTMFRTG